MEYYFGFGHTGELLRDTHWTAVVGGEAERGTSAAEEEEEEAIVDTNFCRFVGFYFNKKI